jgi:hypothetical protein
MLLVLITVVSCAVKAQDTLWFHSGATKYFTRTYVVNVKVI